METSGRGRLRISRRSVLLGAAGVGTGIAVSAVAVAFKGNPSGSSGFVLPSRAPSSGAQGWRIPMDFVPNHPVLVQDTLIVCDQLGVLRSVELDSGRVNWQVQTGIESFTLLVVGDHVLVAGGTNVDEPGDVVVFRRSDGSRVWSRPATPWPRSAAPVGHRTAVVGYADGSLEAVDIENGAVLWHRVPPPGETSWGVDHLHATDKLVVAATQFVRGGDRSHIVHALEPGSGDDVWRIDANYDLTLVPNLTGSEVPWLRVAENRMVHLLRKGQHLNFAADGSGAPDDLVALNLSTGATVWRHSGRDIYTDPVVAGELVFIWAEEAMDGPGELRALDATTGEVIWRNQPRNAGGEPLMRLAEIAVSADTLCLSAVGGMVTFDLASGRRLWSTDEIVFPGPVIVGEYVYGVQQRELGVLSRWKIRDGEGYEEVLRAREIQNIFALRDSVVAGTDQSLVRVST